MSSVQVRFFAPPLPKLRLLRPFLSSCPLLSFPSLCESSISVYFNFSCSISACIRILNKFKITLIFYFRINPLLFSIHRKTFSMLILFANISTVCIFFLVSPSFPQTEFANSLTALFFLLVI